MQSYKYLGVIITSDLSWLEHIQSICNKSRKLVGLHYRQLYLNADSDTLCQFHLLCIRPHLKYVCGTLTCKRENPSGGSAKVCLQSICCKNWNMDYESMLGHLNIPKLQQRRLQLKASKMYRFVHCDSYILEDVLLLHPPSNYDTCNHSYLSVRCPRTNSFYYSFFPHITFLELTSTYSSSSTE